MVVAAGFFDAPVGAVVLVGTAVPVGTVALGATLRSGLTGTLAEVPEVLRAGAGTEAGTVLCAAAMTIVIEASNVRAHSIFCFM